MNSEQYNQILINFYSNLHIEAFTKDKFTTKEHFNSMLEVFSENFNATLAKPFLNKLKDNNKTIYEALTNFPEQFLNSKEGRTEIEKRLYDTVSMTINQVSEYSNLNRKMNEDKKNISLLFLKINLNC